MNKSILFLVMLFSLALQTSAQTIEELYQDDDYEALAEFASKHKGLTARELYCVGYGLYRLDRDKEAIRLYSQAIEMGLDSAYVYHQRGRAYVYLREFATARADFLKSISLEPEIQSSFTEMGMAFAYEGNFDSALVYLRKARELPFSSTQPYTMIPRIYAEQGDAKTAREEYAVSAALMDANSEDYIEFLAEIGRQAYVINEDYPHSVRVYSDLLRRVPDEFIYYPKLIKALHANKEYGLADSVFAILAEAGKAGKLGDEFSRYGRAGIDEFDWKDQLVVAYRYFEIPQESLKPIYIAFLINADGESVERVILTEKTISLEEGGTRHLLCEQPENGHATYSYGWDTDDIPYADFKKVVIKVLDGEMTPAARSYYGGKTVGKKKKKQKRK